MHTRTHLTKQMECDAIVLIYSPLILASHRIVSGQFITREGPPQAKRMVAGARRRVADVLARVHMPLARNAHG
jgi:hypothetical protein